MEGNTQDITTVQGLIEDVKNRFAIKNCTMVFDRGMFSSENLQSPEGEKWSYVSAMEEAFHEIKSHLELRPIHLTREKRVKAHVTICTLAYFLYNDMERRLKKTAINCRRKMP